MVNEKLLQEFIRFPKDFLGEKDYFSCLYGSQAYGVSTEKSDIDVMFAVKNEADVDLSELIRCVVDFHVSHQISLDHEVPYENKILITYDELEKAVNLGGFAVSDDRIVIPEIVKTAEFLSTPAVKMRLALCALTSPHVVFGNNSEKYQTHKQLAERNIVLLAIDLVHDDTFSREAILDVLLNGKNGETDEMYLGYKKYPVVLEYLRSLIERQLIALTSDGVVMYEHDTVHVVSSSLLDKLKKSIPRRQKTEQPH